MIDINYEIYRRIKSGESPEKIAKDYNYSLEEIYYRYASFGQHILMQEKKINREDNAYINYSVTVKPFKPESFKKVIVDIVNYSFCKYSSIIYKINVTLKMFSGV